MQNYVKYKNGIRVDMMGNYHGGCKKSCCQNSWGFPTKKGINNNCKIKLMTVYFYTILVVLITVYCMNKDKECCRITAQEVYEYEGWIIKE